MGGSWNGLFYTPISTAFMPMWNVSIIRRLGTFRWRSVAIRKNAMGLFWLRTRKPRLLGLKPARPCGRPGRNVLSFWSCLQIISCIYVFPGWPEKSITAIRIRWSPLVSMKPGSTSPPVPGFTAAVWPSPKKSARMSRKSWGLPCRSGFPGTRSLPNLAQTTRNPMPSP